MKGNNIELTDEKLEYELGKEDELLGTLQKKINKPKMKQDARENIAIFNVAIIKRKPHCRNRGPLTIACHMKKSSMLSLRCFQQL